MIGILAAVFAIQASAAVMAGARYPSGLNPALCPNYPHCDNALLAAHARPAAGGSADYTDHYSGNGGHYQEHHPYAGHYQPSAVGLYTEPGYPAGLTSSNCPNYPYCSHQVPVEALRYAHKRYPSGVSEQNCPNYPYCY